MTPILYVRRRRAFGGLAGVRGAATRAGGRAAAGRRRVVRRGGAGEGLPCRFAATVDSGYRGGQGRGGLGFTVQAHPHC